MTDWNWDELVEKFKQGRRGGHWKRIEDLVQEILELPKRKGYSPWELCAAVDFLAVLFASSYFQHSPDFESYLRQREKLMRFLIGKNQKEPEFG